METSLDTFLRDSPVASKVKIHSKIVIHRMKLSPKEISEIKTHGKYGPVKKTVYELVCGGQVLAKGRIIKKKGESYFKIDEIL